MGYKMKQGNRKNNTCSDPSPMKGFFGGLAKKIGGAAKGALMGKDGKFGIGDVGRLALGPMGAVAGATGLFMKDGKSPLPMCGCGKKKCNCK